MRKFHKRDGHFRVARGFKEDGLDLGNWVINTRVNKNKLTPDQLKRLNSIDFIWDPLAEQWEQGFAALEMFHQREGHCRIVALHEEDGRKLGVWVSSQRSKKKQLSSEQLKRLNSLGFIWNPHGELWEQGFIALVKFKNTEGHMRVPRGYEENGLDLGGWVISQRSKIKQLSSEQFKRLNSLGFIWDPHTELWEKGFAALTKFQKREGHCLVPQPHIEDGMKLGIWVSNVRARKNQLSPDQLKRLNSLDFSWDSIAEQWERAFAALEKFKKREGHCRVTARHKEDGLKLGNWVGSQRTKKRQLTLDQIARLKALGFSWDPFAEQWERAFAALQKFHTREGHDRVPARHKEDGLNLGGWVSWQRWSKKGIKSDRLKRLNALGFVWKA